MSALRVLIIAPHPDDEIIGCGGAARLRIERGERVSVVFLTSGEVGLRHLSRRQAWLTREAEARRAARLIGFSRLIFLRKPDWVLSQHLEQTARALRSVMARERPEIIYLPHPADGHPDHQAVLPLLRMTLSERSDRHPQLFGYEVWTPMLSPDCLVDISKVMLRKLRALRAHRSQLQDFDYLRAVTGLNQFRGALCTKTRFAEAFCNLSLI